METLKKAFVNEDAIKTFRAQARLAASKERVVHAALNDAANQVARVFGPSFSIDASKDTLEEIRPDVFSGTVQAQLSVETGSGIKRIAYPIEVRASLAILDEDAHVKEVIAKAAAAATSDLDKQADEYSKKVDAKLASLEEELKVEAEVADVMEKQDISHQAAVMEVFNKKAAQDLNFIPGPGLSADSNVGINAVPQTFIRIDKNNLPTFNVGDPLDLNGTPYVCVKVGDTFIEFQLNVL